MKKVTIIAGPTASGKSGLALGLGQAVAGELINADSMQVYAGLPLLTAQPSAEDFEPVPHHLYSTVAPPDEMSVAVWKESARALVERIDRPILVGGSGLYIKAFVEGLSPMPEVPADVRSQARARYDDVGQEAFYQRLSQLDPGIEQVIKPSDTQRMIRAHEVFEATGKSIRYWQSLPKGAYEGNVRIVLLNPPVEKLNQNIARRFDQMIAGGAVEEVQALMTRELLSSHTLLKAIGYPELVRYVMGEVSLDEAKELAVISSRQYAKRQRTWFRHQITADVTIDHFPTEEDVECLKRLYS